MVAALHVMAFLIHVILCMTLWCGVLFESAADYLIRFYHSVGFEWSAQQGVVAIALIQSFSLNFARRVLEGAWLGWPRFRCHDKNSLAQSGVRFAILGFLVVISSGFIGEEYPGISSGSLLDNFFIFSAIYVLGIYVDVVDDFIAAIYVSIRRGV